TILLTSSLRPPEKSADPFYRGTYFYIAELEGKGRGEFAGNFCISMLWNFLEPDWTFAPKAGSYTGLLWKGGF
ncbi:MAG: hypothetical protein ACI30P_00615, partial [Muribaculaceae bacterium]